MSLQISMSRRRLLAAGTALAAPLLAQRSWAEQAVKVLVGFSPGGAIDTTARVYARAVKDSYTMIVENLSGAAGNIAADALARSRPDGNTLMLAPVNVYCISQALYRHLAFNVERDFSPVGILARFPWGLAVAPNTPVKSLAGLIAWLKANPNDAKCGMAAIGSEGHLMAYAFGKAAGIDLSFIGYRGGAPMSQDLMGGQIPMAFDAIINLASLHRAGKIRLLAVSSPARFELVPEVPTFAEAGYPMATGETWIGAAVRKGTSAERIAAFGAAFTAAGRESSLRAKLAAAGLSTSVSTPTEMANTIVADTKRYSALIKAIGLKLG